MTRDKATIDHSGSTLDSLLEEDGILGDVEAVAVKRVFRFLARRPADPEIRRAARRQSRGDRRLDSVKRGGPSTVPCRWF
jgi:hypothetical protein